MTASLFKPGDEVEVFDEGKWRSARVEKIQRWPGKAGEPVVMVVVRPYIGDRLSGSRYGFLGTPEQIRKGDGR